MQGVPAEVHYGIWRSVSPAITCFFVVNIWNQNTLSHKAWGSNLMTQMTLRHVRAKIFFFFK